ncbi:MAG: hypothetical protein ACOH2E_00440 [Candidatus Paracaedibacter sp.]
MFPQARKHCRNGDADTDCDWDNKQNGTEKDGKIVKVRKTQKSEENGIMRRKRLKKKVKKVVEKG